MSTLTDNQIRFAASVLAASILAAVTPDFYPALAVLVSSVLSEAASHTLARYPATGGSKSTAEGRLVHPRITTHSITLRFSDPALEREYLLHHFMTLYPLVVTFFSVMTGILTVFHLAVPVFGPQTACCILLCGSHAAWRVGVGRMSDQESALSIFQWASSSSTTLLGGAYAIAHARFVLVQDVSFNAMACVAFLWVTVWAYYRQIIPDHTPRMFTLLAVVLVWTTPGGLPVSILGKGWEPLLIAAALLIGELIGGLVDYRARRAFLRAVSTRCSNRTRVCPS